MGFPFDLFQQLFEGNWVAWIALALTIVTVGMACFLIFLWWKLPQYAKAGFINNTVGGNQPTIMELYQNKRVKFQIVHLFRSGIGFSKGVWYLFSKAWATSADDLKEGERQLLNSVCSLEGTQSALYLNYSVQANVVNPELVALLQHEKELKKLGEIKKDSSGNMIATVQIKKELFIEALQLVKGDFVQLSPMNLELPIDLTGLRSLMPQSLSKSDLTEQENRIKDDMRKERGGLNLVSIAIFLSVILVILDIVLLLKAFGMM